MKSWARGKRTGTRFIRGRLKANLEKDGYVRYAEIVLIGWKLPVIHNIRYPLPCKDPSQVLHTILCSICFRGKPILYLLLGWTLICNPCYIFIHLCASLHTYVYAHIWTVSLLESVCFYASISIKRHVNSNRINRFSHSLNLKTVRYDFSSRAFALG